MRPRTILLAAALLATLGACVPLMATRAAALTQTFDNCAALDAPTGPGSLALSGTGSAYCITTPCIQGNCLRLSGTMSLVFTGAAGAWCGTLGFSFALPSSGGSPPSIVLSGGANEDMTISVTGSPGSPAAQATATLHTQDSTGAVQTLTGTVLMAATPVANTYYDFSVAWDCITPGASMDNKGLVVRSFAAVANGNNGVAQSYFPTGKTGNSGIVVPNTMTLTSSSGTTSYIDNLLYPGTGTGTLGGVAATYLPASGCTIVGASVDVGGTGALVTRETCTGSVNKVVSIDPQSLVARGPGDTTSCATSPAKTDAVLATNDHTVGKTYISYGYCANSPSYYSNIHIRDQNLANFDPDTAGSAFCVSEDECTTDFGDTGGTYTCGDATAKTVPGNLHQMGTIISFPSSMTHHDTEGNNHITVAYAFEDTGSGGVGVYAYTMVNNDPWNRSCWKVADFAGTGQLVNHICSWRNPADGQEYIGAINGNLMRVWAAKVDTKSIVPTITMTPVYSPSGNSDTGRALACNGNLVLESTSSGNKLQAKYVIGNRTGQSPWPARLATTGTTSRALAISNDGAWATYLKSGDTTQGLVNMTTGLETSTFAQPSGTEVGQWMDDRAQSAWICTSTRCIREDLTPVVGQLVAWTRGDGHGGTACIDGQGNTISCTPAGIAGSPSPAPDDNLFVTRDTPIPPGFTVVTFKAFLGMIFTFCLAAAGYFLFDKSPLGGVFFGIGGFVLAYFFGLFPDWVLLLGVLVFAALGVIGFIRYKGGT